MVKGTCAVDGCVRPHDCKGYCKMHYLRWYRHGDPGPVKPYRDHSFRACRIDGCKKRAVCQELCNGHYEQARLGRTVVKALQPYREAGKRDDRGRKFCPGCDRWLAEGSFSAARSTCDGLRTRCNECRCEEQKTWAEEHPDLVREASLRRLYGISLAQWDELFDSQGRRCAICRTDKTPVIARRKYQWHTDHDHATGVVRGILCHHCNLLLGNAKDDPERLHQAIVYLNRHAAGLAA